MNEIKLFMTLFLIELEYNLKNRKAELLKISFHSDEANTDRALKEYLKNLIENKCNKLDKFKNIKRIDLHNNEGKITTYNISENIRNIFIDKVFLKEEITDDIKKKLKKNKRTVYTNPDICLRINNNGKILYETIELKSTKNDAIPGSSVQQIEPEGFVVFIKHTASDIEIATGQYLNSINSKIQFPDRSPRPEVSFKELYEWNKTFRNIQTDSIAFGKDDQKTEKAELINDWQEVLADRWVDILFGEENKKKIPWFHTNMRKFILSFLDKYEKLNKEQKEAFKENVIKNIEKDRG